MNNFIIIIISFFFISCNKDNNVHSNNQSDLLGCADQNSCNYDPEAINEDNCLYPENYPNHIIDCDGNCINDSDDDGICDEGDYYQLDIDITGEFSFIIIKDSIESLIEGDQIGIFDYNGIVESCFLDTIPPCNFPEYGEVLVGSGIWDGSQMEISSIVSVDLSSFNGPVLNGAIETNPIKVRVWRSQNNQEYETDLFFEEGGSFNSVFTVIENIILK